MKLSFALILVILSFRVSALPLASTKEQLRQELWHRGLEARALGKKSQLTQNKTKPRLNEEVQRALIKYQL